MNIASKLRGAGIDIESPTGELEAFVALLPSDEIMELAVWCARYQLAKMVRESALAAERSAISSPAPKGPPQPEEDAWLTKGWSRNRWGKWQWKIFNSLPDTHPAVSYWEAIEKEDEKARNKLYDSLARNISEYKAALRIEWNAELLQQRISMPDGTVTTWGQATVEQHRERLEMFKANAMANIEGAARHQQAIEDLTASGAQSLESLNAVAA